MIQLDFLGDLGVGDVNEEKDERYTDKVGAPIYTPSERCPFVGELFDKTKYEALIRQINASNVSEQEKAFLRLAASRHIVFK